MIKGIPYFGVENNEILSKIENTKVSNTITYDSVYKLIEAEINKNVIAIIEDKWLTWLTDIMFNYRDNICFLPYYTFELYERNLFKNKSTNKGHMLIKNDKMYIRYNYELHTLQLSEDFKLVVYDLNTEAKYIIKANKWFDEDFDQDKLYSYYVMSAYYEDEHLFNGYHSGYHYIDKQVKGFINKEKEQRKVLNLASYGKCETLTDYRDVRNYKYAQLFGIEKVNSELEQYYKRRVRFDSYLACIIWSNAKSIDEKFNKRLNKLKTTSSILVYAPIGAKFKDPRLILKSYWYGVGDKEDKLTLNIKNV